MCDYVSIRVCFGWEGNLHLCILETVFSESELVCVLFFMIERLWLELLCGRSFAVKICSMKIKLNLGRGF